MPRRPNPLRAEARERGDKFYADALPCATCGDLNRYTVNGGCVTCMRARGRGRYAALDDDGLAAQKAKDAARYRARLTAAGDFE